MDMADERYLDQSRTATMIVGRAIMAISKLRSSPCLLSFGTTTEDIVDVYRSLSRRRNGSGTLDVGSLEEQVSLTGCTTLRVRVRATKFSVTVGN
jgi:hypothetical protein